MRRFAEAIHHEALGFLDLRHDSSMLLFSKEHPLRRLAWCLTHYNEGRLFSFDNFIITLILFSSGMLAYNSCDLDPESGFAQWLRLLDSFASAVFVCEMVLKMVALSLFGYFSSSWNLLDFFIVTASLLSNANPAFRILRVLRPLRLVSRFSGLQRSITMLLLSMPRMGDIVLIFGLFLIIFAVLAVQLFAGKLYSCVDVPALTTREACVGGGHTWANPTFGSFDNVGAASLLLFEMATLED